MPWLDGERTLSGERVGDKLAFRQERQIKDQLADPFDQSIPKLFELGNQQALYPPSTGKITPVIQAAASSHSNGTTRPMCSGTPHRPIGVRATTRS